MTVVVATTEELEQLVERAVERVLARGSTSTVLSTRQAADVAGVQPKTVLEWISSGRLRAGRRGRLRSIRREDLDRFLAGEEPAGGRDQAELARSLERAP